MNNLCNTADLTTFLSTPSARRATYFLLYSIIGTRHFYPRPPRGGRPNHPGTQYEPEYISIHALREEGDGQVRRAEDP